MEPIALDLTPPVDDSPSSQTAAYFDIATGTFAEAVGAEEAGEDVTPRPLWVRDGNAAASSCSDDDDDEEELLLFSQASRQRGAASNSSRSIVTFVGLGDDSDEDAEDHRRPIMPSELVASEVPERPSRDSNNEVEDRRFVPVAMLQPAAALPERPQQHQQVRRHMLNTLSCNEVHRVFQTHWAAEEAGLLAFQCASPSTEDDVQRHRRLVNVSAWCKSQAAASEDGVRDVLLPSALLSQVPITTSVTPASFSLRPHQVSGIRFMWRTLMEGPPLDKVPAVGCILAHSMGLGKTCQVIVFLHLLAREFDHLHRTAPKVVVVAPKSVLASWATEFRKWSAFFEPPDRRIQPVLLDDRVAKPERVAAMEALMQRGGVVLIGYEALVSLEKEFHHRELGVQHSHTSLRESSSSCTPFHHDSSIDLVVCDEGHRLKSSNLDVAKALGKLHALRRLILTGTPMQNHLLEYWAMSDFAVPKFFDRRTFLNFFVKPIEKAADAAATEADVAAAKKRTFILIKEFANFTQRVDTAPLRSELPPLHETVVTVPLSQLQYELYIKFLQCIRREHGARFNVLQAFSYASKICAHPQLVFDMHGDAVSGGGAAASTDVRKKREDGEGGGGLASLAVPPPGYTFRAENGVKMNIVVNIIRAAMKLGEKTLVFSMSTKMLDMLESVIRMTEHAEAVRGPAEGGSRKRDRSGGDSLSTTAALPDEQCDDVSSPRHRQFQRIRFVRIDGGSSAAEREKRIQDFQNNDASSQSYHCFLLSTKAGGVGITVTAATRVVLLDCSFNPADDRQAIGRAYRYGQTKPVHVYRLVCRNTIEHRIFDQKLGKEWMFETVVNDKNVKRDALCGIRLRHMFLMKDQRVLPPPASFGDATIHSAAALRVGLSDRVNQLTDALIAADPVLQSIQHLVFSAAPHDTYLEVSEEESYGADEMDHYQRYKRRGGLEQTTIETPEVQQRLNNAAAKQWEHVHAQTKSLTGILQGLLDERARAVATNPMILGLLQKMGVKTTATGHSPNLSLPNWTPSTRPVAPVVLLVDSDDDSVQESNSPIAAQPTRQQKRPPLVVVNPLMYAPHRPGGTKENAVEVDDDDD